MGSFLSMVRSNIVAQAVMSILLGLLLALWPGVTAVTIIYLLALYLAVLGISSLVTYLRAKDSRSRSAGMMVGGVCLLVIALLAALFPQAVASFFSIILGILLLIGGLVNVVRAIDLRRYDSGMWVAALVAGIVVAIGGAVIIVNPFATAAVFVLVLGILLIVKGVSDLCVAAWLSRSMQQLP